MIKLIFQVEVLSLTENLRVMKAPPPYNMNNAELEEYKRTQQNWAKFVLDIGNGKNFINEFENTVELPGKITFYFYINFISFNILTNLTFRPDFGRITRRMPNFRFWRRRTRLKVRNLIFLCLKKIKI